MRLNQARGLARKRANARPAYERDDGPLTEKQIAALRRLVPPGKLKVISSLL